MKGGDRVQSRRVRKRKEGSEREKEGEKREGMGTEGKEVTEGGALAKETWGTQVQCQFLLELAQDNIKSIRLLLRKGGGIWSLGSPR